MKKYFDIIVEEEGFYRLKKITSSGSYFDQSKIIYDERLGGELPESVRNRLSLDKEKEELTRSWLLGRVSEYPTISQVIEALMENIEGRPEKLAEVLQKRVAVKAKYPKPK